MNIPPEGNLSLSIFIPSVDPPIGNIFKNMKTYISHNQIHFIIKVKGERNRKIRYRKKFHKGRYKDIREYLAKIDRNKTLKNKTATECWNILKSEIDCIIDKFVPLKNRGNGQRRNTYRRKPLEKSSTSK